MLRLVFTTDDGQICCLELQVGRNRLGRAPDNEIPLEETSISGHHCEITLQAGLASVRDLRSTNGTFVNGQPVGDTPVPLHPGQGLQLGNLKMVLEDSAVRVAVPLPVAVKRPQPVAEQGSAPACLNHPETLAIWVCSNCSDHYCNACVHHLRRVGGAFLNLCPHCSHACRLLESARAVAAKSVFTRMKKWLGRTVRLRR